MKVDSGALLQGDSNEEMRMQPRLIEKAENAKQGKMPRVTEADIRPSQKGSPGPPSAASKLIEENKQLDNQLALAFPGQANSTNSNRRKTKGTGVSEMG